MLDDVQKFNEAMDLYVRTFGEVFPMTEIIDKPFNEMTEIVLQYVKSGEPYLEDLKDLDEDELEFHKACMQYKRAFGKTFPTLNFRGETLDKITEMMLQCIKDGKPYKSNLPKGVKI